MNIKTLPHAQPIVLANDVFVGCGGYKRDVVTQKAPTHYMNQKTVMIISQVCASVSFLWICGEVLCWCARCIYVDMRYCTVIRACE